MRVLIFCLAYYPRFIGGAEVAVRQITDRIRADEIEFHMVTLRFDRTLPRCERIGNVVVHRIGPTRRNPSIPDLSRSKLHFSKYLYQFLAAAKAIQLHKRHRYDLVWAVMAHSAGVPAALFKMRFPKVKYLLTLQEGQPPSHVERLARPVWPLFKRAFTSADHVQAISSFLLQWAKEMGAKGRAEVIPNGVDTARFAARDIGPASASARRRGETVLVTTSRLVFKNALDDVIRALPMLAPKVTFVVAGIGNDEDKLRSLAAELGVADRVRFLGEVQQEDLPPLLADCDIFIRPSRSEGLGNSFIEAMAAGLPVIATQEGGISDFLFDEHRNPDRPTTGWAVDRDAPEQIAKAAKDIIAHPEKVASVTRTAKEMVIAKFDWDIVARDMRALFLRLA